MGIIIIILSILLVGTLVYAFHEHKQARERIEVNNEIKEYNAKLERRLEELSVQEQSIKQTMERDLQSLKSIKAATSDALEAQQQMSQKAFENYCDVLETKYQEKAEEFDNMSLQLDAAYDALQDRILAEIKVQESELEKIKATRAALIKAQIKEKQIQENIDFYCLTLPVNDRDDIQRLEKVKKDLHNPRILSMLIWQTFFQKNMTTLCNNVLGTKTITGIYKITNLNTNMCYIGQAVDVASRWKEHAKCGLGIDTPVGNKLYAAMIEEGIWNFSWELLESCERALLDEKEKYYIGVYQASEFGYNSNKGNSKKG
jgi:hypothetical protein